MEFWNAPSRRKCGQWSLVIIVVAIGLSSLQAVDAGLGEWRLVTKNAGISAMHAAVAPVLGTVVLLHQTKTGPSNITFPDGRCRNITYDLLLKTVCYVHSVILDPTSEVVRPIMVMTDTQGSSGQFLGEGSLSQTGGDLEGKKRTSNLSTKCYTTVAQRRYCDWVEGGNGTDLLEQRWYFTNQLLPDGRQIIVGGRQTYTLENYPHTLHRQLYIFANRDSILYDYNQNVVVRKFDKIPDNPRNYPSGSSSVMLPLVYNDNFKKVEILVCGGAATGSVGKNEGQMECSTSLMETMPMPRCMGDMVILPNLNVMLINGVKRDYQGWKSGSETILNPVLYNPRKVAGNRFTVLNPTQTPRVYHSTANLLTDGSIMVAGSNTHQYRSFQSMKSNVDFPTELSVKAFMPPYAENKPNSGGRPVIISVNATNVKYRATIESSTGPSPPSPFSPPPMRTVSNPDSFVFTMTSSFWSSHLFSFGQRVVTLNPLNITTQPESRMENGRWVNARTVQLRIPSHYTVLPRTYYMLWVVKNGNPSSSCAWIRIR
uniref:Galactose oxidase-like Early set domain-containing protein n=1 Tax=Physcomitrium patens TaxID=3218 RepID=A0A2K1KK63_PHYPA|nr:hypothetical protein PHYPA_007847 [Physcomitrium patens]